MEVEAALVVKKEQLDRCLGTNLEDAAQPNVIHSGLKAIGVTSAVAVADVRQRDPETFEILVVPTVSASNADFSDACSRIVSELS